MGFLKNILKKQTDVSGKCLELLQWVKFVDQLHNTDHYISRKEYMPVIHKYSEVMSFFKSLDENDLLTEYCKKTDLQMKERKKYI